MKNLLQSSGKFVDLKKKSNIPPATTVRLQLVCKDRVLLVRVDLNVSLCGQQHSKRKRAIRLVYPPLSCKLPLSSGSTNRTNELSLEIQTTLSR
jgi:hypothetical protein